MGKKETVSIGYQILDNLKRNTELIGQTQQTTNGYGYAILDRLRKENEEIAARSRALDLIEEQRREREERRKEEELENARPDSFMEKVAFGTDVYKLVLQTLPSYLKIKFGQDTETESSPELVQAEQEITAGTETGKEAPRKTGEEVNRGHYEWMDRLQNDATGVAGRSLYGKDVSGGYYQDLLGKRSWDKDTTDQGQGAMEQAGTEQVSRPDAAWRSLYGKDASGSYYQDLLWKSSWGKDTTDRGQGAMEQAGTEQVSRPDAAGRSLYGKDASGSYYQDLLGKRSWDEETTDQGQWQNGAFTMPDAKEIGSMGMEELQALQESVNSYADTLEETELQQLQEKWKQALREGRPQPEIDEISKQINQLLRTIDQWRASADQLSWQMNLLERKATIDAYEQYRENADFQTVADKAQDTEYSRREDPLGYYLDNREMLDAMADIDYSADNWKNWGELKEPEIEMYYYLLGSQGRKAAQEYLDDIQIVLDQRAYETAQESVTELYQGANLAGKIGLNVVGATANAVGGIPAVAGDVASVLTGQGYNPYNQGHSLLDFSNFVQGATSEDIAYSLLDDDTKALMAEYDGLLQKEAQMVLSGKGSQAEYQQLLRRIEAVGNALKQKQEENDQGFNWGQFWSQTYQAVYSGASSAVGAMLFNKGYTAVMGANAASQRARELWEEGASPAEIGMGAMASGLIEMATEKYSVEYFTQNFLSGNIQGPKDWLVKTLIQGFNEGSEEVASEIANQVANALILAGNSDNQREIQELMADGMSREEAEKQAFINRAVDILWAGYGGLVSGAAMGGIGGPVNTFANHVSTGKSVVQNNAGPELVQEARNSGVDEELAKLADEKIQGDIEQMNLLERLNAERTLGRLHEATIQAQVEQAKSAERETFQQTANDKITEMTDQEESGAEEGETAEETPQEAERATFQEAAQEKIEELAEEAGEAKGEKSANRRITGKLNTQQAAEALTKAAYGEKLTAEEKKAVAAVGGKELIREIENSREFQQALEEKYTEISGRMEDTMALTQDTGKQQEIVSRFARENGMDADVMLGSIRRSQDANKFTAAWESAYEMGAGGIALRYAQKAGANSYLTQAQIETAYNEGRKEAGYYEEAAEEGSVSDGGQWNDRAYPGGQVRAVESGAAAQGQSGQQGAGGGIAAAAEKITSIQLGLENGTENRNLQRVTEAAYSEETKAASRVAKDSGLVFVPFSGGAIETWETVNGNKIKVKSRGCVVNGTMYVRVDDSTFTAEQIARHEAAHEQIQKGEIDVEAAKESLLKRYSAQEIDAIIQLYASAYGDSGLTAEQVMEEIICDSMGRMNAFATDSTERIAGEVGVFLRNVRKAAKNTGATKNTTGDGGGKYSLENQRIPTWEELAAKPPIRVVDISKAETSGSFSERRVQIQNRINKIINQPYLNKDTDTLIFLTRKSYTHLFSNHGEIQINAAEHLPELVKNAILTHAEGATHGSEHTKGVYTFFAAAYADGVQPVKIKVKEYRNDGQKIPENVAEYFKGNPNEYASSYDTVVLTVENIEGIPGSAHSMTDESAEKKRPSKPSEIMVADLLNLVKGDAAKYIPEHNSSDIRYSREMDTVKALERQNKLLQEQRDYWKDQTRLTKVAKADKDAVRKLGREILREYSSSTKVDEILTDLQWLADDAAGKGNASFQELTEAAEKIARKVLEGSGVDVNADLAETRKELKQYLRSTPINITESIKAGIADFSDFKKQNRALRFREDGSGTDVDAMWLELQDQFGNGMFPEEITNPEDQVRYIAEKVGQIAEDIQNPYRKDMEFAVQQLTYDILFQTTMVEQKKPTMADKRKERETRAKESVNQEVEKATQELRELVEKGREREKTRVENAQKTSIRQQIRTISDKFQRMATRPGKGISQHAPEGLRKAVVDFCEVFTESELRRMDRWQRNLEYRADELGRKASNVYVATGVVAEAESIREAQARRDRMTARLTKLQNAYAAMKKDGQYQTTYDETVADMIKNLSEILDGKDLYQLETGDLRRVQQTMSAIYYTITNANKAFSMGKDKNISDMATKIAREIRQVNPSQAGMAVLWKRFKQWQMSPDTYFNYLCGFIKDNEGKVIQKGFQKGAERMMGVQREFYQLFREFTESSDKAVHKELSELMNYSKKRMVNWGLKDLEGNEVKTTRGMMIQAYMLLNQKDSFESLQYGGFSIPNAERYYKGDIAGAYGDGLETTMLSESIGTGYTEMIQRNKDLRSRIEGLQQKIEISETESYKQRYQQEINELEKQIQENQQKMEEITSAAAERLYNLQNAIEKQLTPLEKKLIDRAHEWYSNSGKLMADVFEQMYGFRPNLVENYVPIHRDPTTIKTDIRDMAGAEKAFNLENSGFTIERVRNYQPILLTDFFEEINRQKDKMARYVGFAQVQKDFGKIWKTRIDGSGMTVNTLVRARFGAGKTNLGVSGEEYINHYIADVAGGHSSDDLLGKFYGNYAAATLRLNFRVAVSQAASIPTAASVVGWKNMAVGFAKGLPKARNTEYRNELAEKNVWFYQRYRGQGGSTELSEISKKGNVIERVANSGVGKKLFNWCQAVDVFSTGSIMWSAAESYVQSQGMKKESEGYEAAVNEVYTDIIRKSQPNYTTTERSDFLRDNRAHMKMLTMFKTQSNQNFNMLLEANGEFIRMKQDLKNGRNGVTEADVKAAGKKLANASTGVLLGGTVSFVALRTIMNFILGAVDPYRDEETDEVTLESTLEGIGEEMLSSLAGTVALGGQVYDILMPLITGDTYYGLSDSAVSSLSSMLENTVTVIQKGNDATGTQMWKMVNSWCMAFGIPAGNTKKIYDMITMYTRDIQNGTFGQFTSDKTTQSKYRERIVEHYLKGEEDKAADALAMLFAKSSADTDEDAKKEIASGMREYLKKLYIAADISDTEAEKIMAYTGTDDPETYTAKWDFQLEHPEYDNPGKTMIAAYNARGNIDGDTFLAAWAYKNSHKKEEAVDYIQGLKGLTSSQKKKLWDLIKGSWQDKGTPWE